MCKKSLWKPFISRHTAAEIDSNITSLMLLIFGIYWLIDWMENNLEYNQDIIVCHPKHISIKQPYMSLPIPSSRNRTEVLWD